MPQEILSVVECSNSRSLLFRRPGESQSDMSVSVIWRQVDVSDRYRADARVGELVADDFLEFFEDALGDSLLPMRVQINRITP